MSQEASKQLGRLARIYDKVLPRETLDTEVREALEWLSPKQQSQSKRLTAVFILAEIFSNVPSAVSFEHVDSFISLMDQPLQSPDLSLRTATVEVARCAMRLVKMRTPEQRHLYYSKNLAVIEKVFGDKNSTPESVHGALLLLNVMLIETGTYMADKLPGLSETLLSLRSAKNHSIRTALIQIIPRIAKFHIENFADQYLDIWTTHLVAFTAPKKVERAAALEALSQLAILMEYRMKAQMDKIMPVLNDTFTAHAKSKGTSGLLCAELFDCLASMAQAVGSEIEPSLAPILPVLFATEFTQKLIDTLATVARYVPTVRQLIQDNLLNILSMILAKEPLVHVTPAPTTQSATGGSSAFLTPMNGKSDTVSAPVSPRSPSSSGTIYHSGLSASSALVASGHSPRPNQSPFPWMKSFIPPPKPTAVSLLKQ